MYGGRKSQASRSLDQGWKALAFVTLLHRPKVVCGFGTLRAMAADGVRTGGDPELAWREGAAFNCGSEFLRPLLLLDAMAPGGVPA